MAKFRKTKRQRNEERLEKQRKEALARKIQRRIDKMFTPKYEREEKPDVYVPKPTWRPEQPKYKSSNEGVEPVRTFKQPVKYEGELADREQKAKEEKERKSKRVAPAYSKGAYQYITDGTDPKEIGRKNPN